MAVSASLPPHPFSWPFSVLVECIAMCIQWNDLQNCALFADAAADRSGHSVEVGLGQTDRVPAATSLLFYSTNRDCSTES